MLALCDGSRSAAESRRGELRARHPEAPGAWDDAHDFLDAMRRQGVLEVGNEADSSRPTRSEAKPSEGR